MPAEAQLGPVGATAVLLPGKGSPAQLGAWLSFAQDLAVGWRPRWLRSQMSTGPAGTWGPTSLGPSHRVSRPRFTESETEDSAGPSTFTCKPS